VRALYNTSFKARPGWLAPASQPFQNLPQMP
jgi:hypothetical protein